MAVHGRPPVRKSHKIEFIDKRSPKNVNFYDKVKLLPLSTVNNGSGYITMERFFI